MNAWRHIKVARLDWFCHRAPQRIRWRLQLNGASNRLEIVMPNGVLDFKISGKCWVKKQEKQ